MIRIETKLYAKTYRDQPKRGETDAGWCGYASNKEGHIVRQTAGHTTEEAALAALAV